MSLSCLIVDDEQPARELLASYVEKLDFLELVGSCRGPIEAFSVLREKSVDLVFLDIQMPDLKGTDFLRTLDPKPTVIFTTAYPDYALEGYQLDVTDYLLKPFSFERFFQAVNKAVQQVKLKNNSGAVETESYSATTEQKPHKNYITVKSGHRLHKLQWDDILYIEGLREYVTFYTGNGKLVVLDSLKRLEEELPSSQFMRIHKSYIVNTGKVQSLYGNQLEIGEQKLPVGKSYKEVVMERLF